MLNQTSWWKYLVVTVFTAIGIYFALPNLFGSDPGIQIRGARGLTLQANTLERVEAALEAVSYTHLTLPTILRV